LNPLESRKQLLIAESELNRAQLVQEWQAMADGVRSVADRARTLGSAASAAAALVAGLASFRRKKSAPAAEKPSWLQTLFKGAELISTIWQAFRSPGRDRDGI
jgi:negative regulator of sigma E activity